MARIPEISSSARRVIVVDDDLAVRNQLVRVLLDSGYCALPAANGRHAQQLVEALDVAVAIIDLEMPGDGGWATLAALRHSQPKLKAIIISAWPHQQEIARAAGASACFEKPLDFPDLLAAVADAIADGRHEVPKQFPTLS